MNTRCYVVGRAGMLLTGAGILALGNVDAWAQKQLYRCGNVYQEKPCAPGKGSAVKIRDNTVDAPPDSAAKAAAAPSEAGKGTGLPRPNQSSLPPP